MQRRKFLAMASAAIPSFAIGENVAINQLPPTKAFVVKSGESRFNEETKLNGKSPNDIKVSMKDTNSQLTIFEYTGNEKGGPPLHIHLKQDEIFFIVEGDYIFKVGEETFNLKQGDTIFLPRMVPHAFAQTSEKGKMFFMFQPSGKMEDFFRKIASLKAPPTPELGAKIFAQHEMKVVGPPIQF